MSRANSIILGTAGHIDHGKTALVRALTGVDTDRLKEEKARGITIELGFAELIEDGAVHMGVVDVPGHEGFVRTMVAGATGMDLVLLVVAADEGVMPQTREHLAIIELLGVPSLVVALTKSDLVAPEWLELVDAEVAELLAPTRYAHAPRLATSASTGAGLDELRKALSAAAAGAEAGRQTEDLARLPLDRVFTVQGTGTVVTGTLWTGTLEAGTRARLLPGGTEVRIRALQVHGRDVARAYAGDRTAVALTGAGVDHHVVERGSVLVTHPAWEETWMLTVRTRVLGDTGWGLAHNQRVRVHLGTAELLARCALLEGRALGAGEEGWIQLRLEEPTVARAGDAVILRSYSPMETLGGGLVAEPIPPKRRHLDRATAHALERVLEGAHRPGSGTAVAAVAELAAWAGAREERLPVSTGGTPAQVRGGLDSLREGGGVESGGIVFSAEVVDEARRRILDALAAEHEAHALRPVVALERLRAALPDWSDPALPEAVLSRLSERGEIELAGGGARAPGFEPELRPQQEDACRAILDVYHPAGLTPPFVHELPPQIAGREDLADLLRHLEAGGELRSVADGLFFSVPALTQAEHDVVSVLGGRTGLGPADFREVLPVSRKHLIPLLVHFDGRGVTIRRNQLRDVPKRS